MNRPSPLRDPLSGAAELRAVVDASPDPFLILDVNGCVVDGNYALARELGVPAVEQVFGAR